MEQLETTVRRMTLTDEVYEIVRGQIIGHRVEAGERLAIEALSRHLGVSPTPVREALTRLASEGLATYESLVGYAVAAPLDADGFDRLMEARFAVEPELAALAAQRIEPGQAATLPGRAALDDPDPEAIPEPYERYNVHIARDAAFHAAVAEAAASPFLEGALMGLHAHVHMYRLHHLGDGPRSTLGEHAAIAEAICSRDSAAARDAMRAHLDAAYHRHSAGLRLADPARRD